MSGSIKWPAAADPEVTPSCAKRVLNLSLQLTNWSVTVPLNTGFGKDFNDLTRRAELKIQEETEHLLQMAFFKAKRQSKYFCLENPELLSGGEEEAENSIGGERRKSRNNGLIEAKRPLCNRCSSLARDVFRWRSRNSGQIKQRKQYTLPRNRVNENREDSKVDATPVHQDSACTEIYSGARFNRRMAICEQLEKYTSAGETTLYGLRRELVILFLLKKFELLSGSSNILTEK